MNKSLAAWPAVSALVVMLAGCAVEGQDDMSETSGAHLSAQECTDLTTIRTHGPVTHARNMSELSALEKAGYQPWFWDYFYPDDIQTAQHRVNAWYEAECPQARMQ